MSAPCPVKPDSRQDVQRSSLSAEVMIALLGDTNIYYTRTIFIVFSYDTLIQAVCLPGFSNYSLLPFFNGAATRVHYRCYMPGGPTRLRQPQLLPRQPVLRLLLPHSPRWRQRVLRRETFFCLGACFHGLLLACPTAPPPLP